MSWLRPRKNNVSFGRARGWGLKSFPFYFCFDPRQRHNSRPIEKKSKSLRAIRFAEKTFFIAGVNFVSFIDPANPRIITFFA